MPFSKYLSNELEGTIKKIAKLFTKEITGKTPNEITEIIIKKINITYEFSKKKF